MTLDLQPVLTGELLELRPLVPGDWDALFRAAADPLLWAQHPEHTRWQEPVFRQFFEGALASRGAFVIRERVSGEVVGSSRYHDYDPVEGVVEIGWTFLVRRLWGGRHNAELKRLMITHAFSGVGRVHFMVGPENWRSRKAVEKLGAVLVGTVTNPRGGSSVVYELTPARYATSRY